MAANLTTAPSDQRSCYATAATGGGGTFTVAYTLVDEQYDIDGRRMQPRPAPGTSAGFWLGGSMPPCRLRRRKFRKFDYEMVHSEVYLNKCVVSIAPFSTPACPDCPDKH